MPDFSPGDEAAFSAWVTTTAAPGDIWYVLSGNYNFAADVSSPVLSGNAANRISIIGVTDLGTHAEATGTDRPLFTFAANCELQVNDYWTIRNLRLIGNTGNPLLRADLYAILQNLDSDNAGAGFGIELGSSYSLLQNSRSRSVGGSAVKCWSYATVVDNELYGSIVGVTVRGQYDKIIGNVFHGNTTDFAFEFQGNYITVKKNTFYGSTTGITSPVVTAGCKFLNNIFSDCTTPANWAAGVGTTDFWDYNCWWNSDTPVNVTKGPHAINEDPAFLDPANLDFRTTNPNIRNIGLTAVTVGAIDDADGYHKEGYDLGGMLQHDTDNHVVAAPPADFLKTLTNYGMGEAAGLPWTTPGGGFVWNPDCWFPGLDLSGIGSYYSASNRWYSASAISRRHVLACQHVSLPIGGKMYFIKPTGAVHVATIVSRQQIGTSDHYVGYLDADLPADHTFYRLLAPNYDDYLTYDPTDLADIGDVAPDGLCGKPIVVFDQQRKMFLARFWKFNSATHFTAAVHGPKYPQRVQYFPEGVELGDSGAPNMLLLDRELILLGTNHYALGIGYVSSQECMTAAQQAGINAAMIALDAGGTGYTLSLCPLTKQTYTEGYEAGDSVGYAVGYPTGYAAGQAALIPASPIDMHLDHYLLDGLETVTIDGVNTPYAWREREYVREQDPSEGVYLSRNVDFTFAANVGTVPNVGGLILDTAGHAYLITEVSPPFTGTSTGDYWRAKSRDCVIADTYSLDNTVSLYPAVDTLDAWGSKITTYPTAAPTFTAIAAKIVLLPATAEEVAGQTQFTERYDIYVDQQIGQVHNGDLIQDEDAKWYQIVSYRNRTRIDELSVIECELRPHR